MPSRTGSSFLALRPNQQQLQLLGELAGIYMDPKIFRILVSLLNMGVDANTVYTVLKLIEKSKHRIRSTSSKAAK